MLRVAHVLNSPGCGGVPRVVEALVRHANPDRIAPHVFYLKSGAGPNPYTDLGIPVRAAQSASKAAAMLDLVAFLDNNKIDVLHTHSFRPNLYGRMAGAALRKSGLRIVAHYHNDYRAMWTEEAVYTERHLARVTDIGFAVSSAVASQVAETVGLVCEIAENGVDLRRVTGGNRAQARRGFGLSESDFAVGLVGRVCHQKGVDTFVEAALLCLEQARHMQFVIVGHAEDAALHARLTTRIEDAGVAHRIRFLGQRDDMANVYAALDLLTAPSRWEGFGLMLAEAMAAGVPVVASNAGGIPGVLGPAGVLVPPDNSAVLSKVCLAVAADPAQRSDLIRLGLVQAQRFGWSKTAARITRHYERIVGKTCASF